MTQEVKLRRVQCNYQAENARFLLECDFSKQYSHYYRKRLDKTRPYLEYNCRLKWDPNIAIYNLSEVAQFGAGRDSDADSDFSSPPFSPPESTSDKTAALFCNYKFEKRFRKLSEASPSSQLGRPRTSTQNPEQESSPKIDADGKDEMNSLFTSPIMPGQRLPSLSGRTESPTIRRPTDGRSAKCIVIGTIFKRMKLQPDVVEELSRGDFHVKCEKYLGHYTSQDDTLVLEDMEESIQLVGNIDPKLFVTGITVALLGVSIDDGSQFMVFDTCFAEPNRQLLYDDDNTGPPEPPLNVVDPRPIYLMLVSGLGFHHEMNNKSSLTRALQDMIDFIWGGAKFADDPRSSRVARILVVGNSLHEDRFLVNGDEDSPSDPRGKDEIIVKMKKSRQVKQYSESIQAAKHMDDFFAQLSKTINVDVMPGPSDPSSHLMPQQPFHPCMLPKSCMFTTFNCTTNPHHAIYNGNVEVLATSGQNVDIISKFSGLSDSIDIMKCHLLWGNCAPSAPDNLYSVPYEDDDPYVIDFIPDIYVAGCQSSYKTDYYYYNSTRDSTRDQQQSATNSLCNDSELADSTAINITPDSMRESMAPAKKAHTNQSNSTPKMSTKTAGSRRNYIHQNNITPDGTPSIAGELDSDATVGQKRTRNPSTTSESYFNETGFSSDRVENTKKSRTLLVTVPKFCETFSCVLINLKTLESHLLAFN